jgi:eukaryotic-like serine/threonine-protein kinase
LLYMMTTGKHPFRGDDQAQTIARISSDEPAILPGTLHPGYPPGLEAVVMQALAKDAAKRYPSANDMLLGLTRALPSAMRESTDEEVAEFLRRLVPDRVERQKQAIKQALEAADRREMSKSTPNLHLPPQPTDEPATVLEGIGREMTPSADGRSLPGASSTEPPPSFARAERSRIRNLLLGAGVGILALGLGLGFIFGRDEGMPGGAAAGSPMPPQPSAEATPAITTPPAPPLPSGVPPEALPQEAEPTPSASAPVTGTPRPAGGKRTAVKPAPGKKKDPFVSPIRNPGF